jgi:hypothetical protein
MADLQKEFINKMVENGSMTEEQGNTAISNIDDALANGTYSMGGMGKEFGDRGKRSDFHGFKINTSKLTDEQKADLESSFQEIADLQKELVNKQVLEGLITEAKGEEAIKKIDESLDNDNYLCGMGQYKFELYRMFGFNQSNLTDEQKAELKDYSEKIAAIKKEIISKEVDFGLLTEEQGDAASQRIDNMDSSVNMDSGKFQFGSREGMKRGSKGMMNGRGSRGNFNKGTDTTSTTSTASPTT